MKYFDTDVLIHSFVNQDLNRHLKTGDLIEETIAAENLVVSWLSIQEVGFVLAKLGQPAPFIIAKLKFLGLAYPVQYHQVEFLRAMQLAEIIGFKDFNDCLHTAIAEQYCSDLFTCNYKDFKRIEPHTTLNIHYL